MLALGAVAPRPVALPDAWAGSHVLHRRGGNGRRPVRPHGDGAAERRERSSTGAPDSPAATPRARWTTGSTATPGSSPRARRPPAQKEAHHWRTRRPPIVRPTPTPGCRCPAVPDRLEVSERGRPAGAALESAPPRGSSPMIRGGAPPAAPEFPLTPRALAVPAWPVPSG